MKFKDFAHVTRVAITGRSEGPPLFEIMVILGREVCLKRIREAQRRLDEHVQIKKLAACRYANQTLKKGENDEDSFRCKSNQGL